MPRTKRASHAVCYDDDDEPALLDEPRGPVCATLAKLKARVRASETKKSLDELIVAADADAGKRAKPLPPVIIANIVATAHVGYRVVLEDLARPISELLVIREKRRRKMIVPLKIALRGFCKGAKILLFSNGKLVCVGTKSIEHARIALYEIRHYINDFYEKKDTPSLKDFRIQNIVTNFEIDWPTDLPEMSILEGHMEHTRYERVRGRGFPGLIYDAGHICDGAQGLTFLYFSRGPKTLDSTAVITAGSKTLEIAAAAHVFAARLLLDNRQDIWWNPTRTPNFRGKERRSKRIAAGV